MKNTNIHKTAIRLFQLIMATALFCACEKEDQQEIKAIRLQTPEAGAQFDLSEGNVQFRWQVSGILPDGYNFILASDPGETDRKVYPMLATTFSREMAAVDLDLVLKQWGYEAGTSATIYWRVESVADGVDTEPLREITLRRLEAEPVEIAQSEPSENAIFDLRALETVGFSWVGNADITSYALEFSLTADGEKLNIDTGEIDLSNISDNSIAIPVETLQTIIEGTGQTSSVIGLFWKVRSNSREVPGASASRRVRFIQQNATEVAPVGELKAVPGYKRAQLSWIIDDPQTTRIVISWPGGSKTVEVTKNDDRMTTIVEELPEGEVTFTVVSYDAQDRESDPVTVTANIYGDTFSQGLVNRTVTLEKLTREGITLNFSAESSSYLLYSELAYTDATGQPAVLRIENDETSRVLDPASMTLGTTVSLTSCYAPEQEVLDPYIPENPSEAYIPVYGLMNKELHARVSGVACDHGENPGFPVSMMFDGITTDPLNMWHTSGDSPNASNNDQSLVDSPIMLTLDLGAEAHLSSLVIWGRYGGTPDNPLYDGTLPLVKGASYWAFGSYNARVFEVWGSNVTPSDLSNEAVWKADGTWKTSGGWTKLADCEIERPSGCPATCFGDEDLSVYPDAYPPSAEDFAAAANGFEFPIAADQPAVRYIRLVVTTNWNYYQRKRISQGELSFYAYEPQNGN